MVSTHVASRGGPSLETHHKREPACSSSSLDLSISFAASLIPLECIACVVVGASWKLVFDCALSGWGGGGVVGRGCQRIVKYSFRATTYPACLQLVQECLCDVEACLGGITFPVDKANNEVAALSIRPGGKLEACLGSLPGNPRLAHGGVPWAAGSGWASELLLWTAARSVVGRTC